MTKLCPRGKAAAKRKFKVYPSAYANAYASKICAGKIKDPSGVKRKDFRGPKKAMGGRIGYSEGTPDRKASKQVRSKKPFETIDKKRQMTDGPIIKFPKMGQPDLPTPRDQRRPGLKPRKNRAGGGLMEATARLKRQGLKGGGICTKGMNRDAVGKNS